MPIASVNSTAPPITATGMQGFLQWFQREQPALFKQLKPKLPKLIPAAFTAKIGDLYDVINDTYARRRGQSSQALGDYGDYLSPITVYADSPDPISVDYSSSLSTPINYSSSPIAYSSNPVTTNYSNLSTVDTSNIPASYTALPTDDNGNVISAPSGGGGTTYSSAGSGSTVLPPIQGVSSGTIPMSSTAGLAAAIAAATAAALGVAASNSQQNLVNSQLNRASQGLAPLNTSVGASGVPTATSTTSKSTLILLLAAAGGAFLLMGDNKKK